MIGVTMGGAEGSSPLARGLQTHRTIREPLHRIIPARAGFTSDFSGERFERRDHPRSRGVYQRRQHHHLPDDGSSPLARGLPERRRTISRPRGIIPARAGFTTYLEVLETIKRDHPRSRGVYPGGGVMEPMCPGSSPLARGLRWRAFRTAASSRIIPARAGFTSLSSPAPERYPDHPRSRGVYDIFRGS